MRHFAELPGFVLVLLRGEKNGQMDPNVSQRNANRLFHPNPFIRVPLLAAGLIFGLVALDGAGGPGNRYGGVQ